MKSYLSLVPISARVHKRQSRMTRICIILAVFLVTAIFSMAEMWIRAETEQMIRKHGNYHIILQDISEDTSQKIGGRPDVAVSSWHDGINTKGEQEYGINGKNTVLYGVDKTYITDVMGYTQEGSFPQNDREVMLSSDAKQLFGISTGDTVTLHTPEGDLEYIVSGFCKDDAQFNDMIDGCCVYMARTAFDEVRNLNHEASSPQYYIRFQDGAGVRKAIDDIKEQYGLSSENIDENTAVMGLMGASSNETMKNIYPLAAVCFFLILIAGILMISGCMNSMVAQRTKFFGMMRCIGASKRQIIRFVRLEALNWCKTAIPEGCMLGMATCWALCAILRFIVKGEWADMPLFGVSISGIACGAAVGIITVFIAVHSPAKQAAKVSPVSAVSGNAGMEKRRGYAADTRIFRVETALGIRHASEGKKNLFLMTGSFSLMIVLFLAFSACLDLVDRLIPSASDFSTDLTISSQDDANSIDKSLLEKISKLPGVEAAFGTMLNMEYPVEINGSEGAVDLFSYDEFMLDNTEKSVVSGDLSKVYGDSGYALAIFNQNIRLAVGDEIRIGDEKIEIACVASEGVGGVSGAATVVCSEETFTRLTGEQKYRMINVLLDQDAPEETVNEIQGMAGGSLFLDKREDNQAVYGSYWVFRLAAYGFLAIISFITVLNIMNSISMGVTARTRQYGMMRAVGMESRQVTKMIAAEAVTYAASGTAAGIICGLILHYLIYVRAVVTHFGGTWKIPGGPLAVILLIVSASCMAAVYAPARRMGKMAVTETINEL